MRIMITGASGFIGFHFSNFFLSNKRNKVCGIDELNEYYDIKLKKERLNILKLKKNFYFKKLDISKKKSLEKVFKSFKPDVIYHFAAQAGVRHSLENPRKYFVSNCLGFFNLFELIRKYKVKKVYYASSSSVYGDTKSFPTNENTKRNPKNFYAVTKCFNEDTAKIYSKMYDINTICLRFFTVFGEWGRPDMFIYKLLNAKRTNKIFNIFNYGKYLRDFTYIEDAIRQVNSIKRKNKNHEIYNICSSKPVSLKKIISIISKITTLPKIIFTKKNNLDVLKTFGSNKKISNKNKLIQTPIEVSISKTVNWYIRHYKI